MAVPNVNPAGLNNGQPTGPTQGFQFPNFNVPFPYLNLPAQLQASMQTPRGQTYGRFGNMPATAQGTPGSLPQLPPQAQGTLPQLPQQGSGFLPVQPPSPAGLPQLPGTGDPNFGAPPSSAAFANLTDADKAFLWHMNRQYQQDMRALPGSHELFKDLFRGDHPKLEVASLINDIGYNNPLLPSFDVNSYNGPMRSLYDNLVQSKGGTVNPYGTSTGSTYRQVEPTGGGLIDLRQYFSSGAGRAS